MKPENENLPITASKKDLIELGNNYGTTIKDATMEQKQIATAQELSKLEGMENSELVIVEYTSAISGHYTIIEKREDFNEKCYSVIHGPYLRVGDSSEWSSAKLYKSIRSEIYDSINDKTERGIFALDTGLIHIRDLSEIGLIEKIIYFGKKYPEAYLKAMEPLK